MIQCVYRSFYTQEAYQRADENHSHLSLYQLCNGEDAVRGDGRQEINGGFLDSNFPTDKCSSRHDYLRFYDSFLHQYQQRVNGINLLEVGVKNGGSLKLWSSFFDASSRIFGVDVNTGAPQFPGEPNIKVLLGDSRLAKFPAFNKLCFSIIVDDGYHSSDFQAATFYNFVQHLCHDGVYIIEDVRDPVGLRRKLGKVLNNNMVIEPIDIYADELMLVHYADFDLKNAAV
jgi:hypothetical protein